MAKTKTVNTKKNLSTKPDNIKQSIEAKWWLDHLKQEDSRAPSFLGCNGE